MSLYEQWCEAGFPPDSFGGKTPQLLRRALAGYRERVNKAIEIAGGKVTRDKGNGPSMERMRAHFSTMAHKGLMVAKKVA